MKRGQKGVPQTCACGRVCGSSAVYVVHKRKCLWPRTLERFLELAIVEWVEDGDHWFIRGPKSKTIHDLPYRTVYELVYGPLQADKPQVNHLYRCNPCVNPEHLYAGTQRDNMRDAVHDGTHVTLTISEESRRRQIEGGRRGLAKAREVWGDALPDAMRVAQRIGLSHRVKCGECSMITSYGPLGRHQKATGHMGKIRVLPETET